MPHYFNSLLSLLKCIQIHVRQSGLEKDLHQECCTKALLLKFYLQGIARTMAGPSMPDLQKQTQLSQSDFSGIYTGCSVSFPLGNLLGK